MTCPRLQLASGTFGVQPQDCLILNTVVLSSCHCTSSPVELECSLCLTFIFLSFRMPLWLTTPTRIHSDPQGSPQMAPYPHHLLPLQTNTSTQSHLQSTATSTTWETRLITRRGRGSGSCSVVSSFCDPMDYSAGQNTGVCSLSLLQGSQLRIKPRFPTLRADSLPAKPQGKSKNTGVGSLSLL